MKNEIIHIDSLVHNPFVVEGWTWPKCSTRIDLAKLPLPIWPDNCFGLFCDINCPLLRQSRLYGRALRIRPIIRVLYAIPGGPYKASKSPEWQSGRRFRYCIRPTLPLQFCARVYQNCLHKCFVHRNACMMHELWQILIVNRTGLLNRTTLLVIPCAG